jgi:hypothetical protein
VKELQVMSIQSVTDAVGKHFGVGAEIGKHYDAQSANVVYKFSRADEPIQLERLIEEGNLLNPKRPNRPIVILHLDPRSSPLLISSSSFTTTKVPVGWAVNVNSANGTQIRALIFDHKLSPNAELQIISPQPKPKEPQSTLTQQQMVEKWEDLLFKNEQRL